MKADYSPMVHQVAEALPFFIGILAFVLALRLLEQFQADASGGVGAEVVARIGSGVATQCCPSRRSTISRPAEYPMPPTSCGR